VVPRFTVDPGADLHLPVRELERGPARRGQDRRRQADPHRRGARDRILGDPCHLVETVAAFGGRSGALVGEEDPGHAAAFARPVPGLARHVVDAQHGTGLDAVELGHVGPEVEVEDVTAVVAVEVEHTGAAVGGLGCLVALLGGGRGEHVADGDRGAEAVTDVPLEEREVPGSASGDDADMALHRCVGADQDTPVIGRRPEKVRVGEEESIHHLVDEPLRVVDDLLHWAASGRDLGGLRGLFTRRRRLIWSITRVRIRITPCAMAYS
jgi:hypothetical protein